ncbi:unnamed protein product [Ascophyllum nodosum]
MTSTERAIDRSRGAASGRVLSERSLGYCMVRCGASFRRRSMLGIGTPGRTNLRYSC